MSEVLDRAILAAAARREDGTVIVSEIFDPEAAAAAIERLLATGFIEAVVDPKKEIAESPTDTGLRVGLRITEAGRQAVFRHFSEQGGPRLVR